MVSPCSYATAVRLFEDVWQTGQSVRLIGVGVSGQGPPLRQLGLWDVAAERQRQLQEALDALRARFGDGVVRRASELGEREWRRPDKTQIRGERIGLGTYR